MTVRLGAAIRAEPRASILAVDALASGVYRSGLLRRGLMGSNGTAFSRYPLESIITSRWRQGEHFEGS